jgi:hypothetical protein
MAIYNVSAAEHGAYAKQLAANAVDTVNFAKDLNRIEVVSDGTAAVYVTTDGPDPAVGSAAAWELPAGGATIREIVVPTLGNTVVKLISAGTPKYSVAEPSS